MAAKTGEGKTVRQSAGGREAANKQTVTFYTVNDAFLTSVVSVEPVVADGVSRVGTVLPYVYIALKIMPVPR